MSKLRIIDPVECSSCGCTDTTWRLFKQNRSGVQNGLLGVHDIMVVMALGCNGCSDTLEIMSDDEVNRQVGLMIEAIQKLTKHTKDSDTMTAEILRNLRDDLAS